MTMKILGKQREVKKLGNGYALIWMNDVEEVGRQGFLTKEEWQWWEELKAVSKAQSNEDQNAGGNLNDRKRGIGEDN